MAASQELRDALRPILQQRRQQMIDDLRGEAHNDEGGLEVRSYRDTTDDDAVVDSMDALEIAATARDAQELGAIDDALARLGKDDFGECVDCGCDIEPARLLAEPTVLRCTACQQRYEHLHHTPVGGRL